MLTVELTKKTVIPEAGGRRRRRGTVVIYCAAAMVIFTGLAMLGVDVGHAWVVKRQLQTAADAAARYGVAGLSDNTTTSKAITAAGANMVDGSYQVLLSSDVTVGTWSGGTFTPGGNNTNAVRVVAVRSAARGNAVSVLFGGLLGIVNTDVTATAIASNVGTSGGGFIGLNGFRMSGGIVDSYYSAQAYNAFNSSPQNSGIVSSNAAVNLSGSAKINGSVTLGPSGSYSGTVTQVTGTIANLPSPFAYPNVSAGQYATSNDNANIPSTFIDSSRNLTVPGGKSLTLPGGVYYVNKFTTSGSGQIIFTGPVTIYTTSTISVSGGALVTSQSIPDNLKIYNTSTATTTISGSGTLYSEVYANQSDVTVSGSGIVAGSIIGNTINNSGGASLYRDLSATGGLKISIVQ